MPTVMRHGKYRFFVFSNERNEPKHIHVESAGNYAKFWLEPVDLESSVGYKSIELAEIRKLIHESILFLRARWDAHFGS